MAWLLGSRLFGQPSDENLWDRTAQIPTGGNVAQAWVQPPVFHPFYLRHAALQPILRAAPNEAAQRAFASKSIITLPMPDGTVARFRFVESPVMAPKLA